MPAHDKTYNKTCETSKDSDQSVHQHSLIRVFADHVVYILQAIQRGINYNSWHTGLMNMLIRVFAAHTAFIVGFVVC